jgi:PAS domain S-box-containing protein
LAEDGTIIWANRAELELVGYTAEEYIGHHVTEFHSDGTSIRDLLCQLRANQKINGWNAQLRCKDGSVRLVTISASSFCDNGQLVQAFATIDLAEQTAASEVHQRLAAIVESSDDAIISKDLNGIVRSWNRGAERIFGYTADEIIGRHISTLAVPNHADEFPDILERIRRGERVDHYQTKRRAKDGTIVLVSLTVSPVRDATGRIVGASKVARDITERERQELALRDANAALVQSNADLQQFAYSASHDLQEPLRMVATYSEMLRRRFGEKLGQNGDEYIGYIIQGALRMEQLLKDLRAYAQASIGAQETAEDADAGEILEKILSSLNAAIEECGALITHGELPRVRMHDFQLEQLFQNLVANSIRYRRGDPPRIHIAAVRHGRKWQFSVQDNGIGIAPQYKEQIFGIFKRLHSSAEYPGTGMGLAICQRILERCGGRIWVESELGRGSTFYFTIPV